MTEPVGAQATTAAAGRTTVDELVNDLIRDFERRSAPRRIAAAPAARARLDELGLSETTTEALWEQCFEPLLARALRTLETRRRELSENPGAVVLKAAAALVERHPRRLDRTTCAAMLAGDERLRGDDELFGVAAGVPVETVERLVGQMVEKGMLAETGGRLERRRG